MVKSAKFNNKPKRGDKIKVYMPRGKDAVFGIAQEIVEREEVYTPHTKDAEPITRYVEYLVVNVHSKVYELPDCDFCLDYTRCIVQ